MINNEYINKLLKLKMFDGFTQENLIEFLSNLKINLNTYSKGDIVFREEIEYPYICILLEGEILIYNIDEHGNRNIIDVVHNGVFAESFALSTDRISPVTSQATKPSVIMTINTDELLSFNKSESVELMKEKHKMVTNILGIFANKNKILMSKINIMSKRHTRSKIIHFLNIYSIKNNSQIFEIPFSRKDMADFLGVDRSALSRELSKMKEEKLIDYYKSTFKILSPLE